MFLIRYELPTVGQVYVSGPHFGGVYSHTGKVAEAAVWHSAEAALADLLRQGWRNGVIVPGGSAEALPARAA